MTETVTQLAPRRVFRKILIVTISIASLPAGIAVWTYLLHDWSNKPLCNKALMMTVQNWFDLHKESSEMPNTEGKSVASFRQFQPYLEDETEKWTEYYRYIPGLRRGDPGDLVLTYLKSPTRWRHHAAGPSSIFDDRKWILVPFDFTGMNGGDITKRVIREMPDIGEDAERVTFEEFKSRLRRTLDFLRLNNRPSWQTVVAENETFLKSLESQ